MAISQITSGRSLIYSKKSVGPRMEEFQHYLDILGKTSLPDLLKANNLKSFKVFTKFTSYSKSLLTTERRLTGQ